MSENELLSRDFFDGRQDGKLLTFCLEDNSYGVLISKVNEIVGISPITPMPKTPDFMKGVINLRGKIIPVMDARLKLGMNAKPYDENTSIIIVNLNYHNITKQVGFIVDYVSEVCTINSADVEEPPIYSSENELNFILGIGKIKNKVVVLLDIEEVITAGDVLHIFKDIETL